MIIYIIYLYNIIILQYVVIYNIIYTVYSIYIYIIDYTINVSRILAPGGAGGLQGLEFLRCLADQRLQGRGGGAHHSRPEGSEKKWEVKQEKYMKYGWNGDF